jgi:hypothetical protein
MTRLYELPQATKRMEAQAERRGIGNLQEEVENRVVTAVVENNGSLEDLTNVLRSRLCDPNAWKKVD